jgi:hypothetical protein
MTCATVKTELKQCISFTQGLCPLSRNSHKILVVKPRGKRQIRRSRHEWQDSITMDVRKIKSGGYGLDSSGSVLRQLAGCCKHCDELSDFVKGG